MNDVIKRFGVAFKNKKVIFGIGIIGVLLIFLSGLLPNDTQETKAVDNNFDVDTYKQALEKDVTKLTKDISGCKSVTVVITLEGGIKYNYADEIKSGEDNRNSNSTTETSSESEQTRVIVTDSSGNEKALVVNEELPQIRGVAVVYNGPNNEQTNEKIKNALMATLSITSKRIYISGKGGIQN